MAPKKSRRVTIIFYDDVELIENLKEKNPTWNETTSIYERPVTRSLFMGENSDIDDR